MTTEKRFDAFLSHHSADKPAVEELALKLQTARFEVFLDKWNLIPGKPWQEDLEKALRQSRTCVVFLGPSGPGPWENVEMRTALDQAVPDKTFRVIPVLLPGTSMPEPGDLPPFLSRLTWVDFRQGLEDEEGFRRLICGIQEKEPGPSTEHDPTVEDVCPFRGLEPFDAEHTRFFCGREALTQYLVEALRRSRFLAILGPSGSGKSSAIRAGLIPALNNGALPGSADWKLLVMKPGSRPLAELAAHLMRLSSQDTDPVSCILQLQESLRTDARALDAGLRLAFMEHGRTARILIVVDQFEELFIQSSDEDRQAFLNNLLYASGITDGLVSLVVALRADFYARAAIYPELADRVAAYQLVVTPMLEGELRQAIELPAQRVGLTFDDGLVDTIMRDLQGQPGALPLLEHALLALWEKRQGSRLTFDAYEQIGRVNGALAHWAEEVYTDFSSSQQTIARRILLGLVEPGKGTEDTRRRASLVEFLTEPEHTSEVETVIERLASARLLTTDCDAASGEKLVDIAHEALLYDWPRLRSWIEESRSALRIHRWLSANAEEWARLERDEGNLMRGAQLAEVEAWSVEHGQEMSGLEREFLASSLAFRKREEEREEELRQLRALELERRLDLAHSDLVLFVHYDKQDDDIVLTYQLSIQNPKFGLVHEGFSPQRISSSSELFTYFKELLRAIEDLSVQRAGAQLKAQRRLAGIGEILFKEFVPEKLQAKLWELHDPKRAPQDPAPSLQLLSNEVLIPWELLKLPDKPAGGSGSFLVETFAFTRWLSGCHQILEFPLCEIATVVPDPSLLPTAYSEREFIRTLESNGRKVTDIPARYNPLIDHLASGRFDAWHFCGNCAIRGAHPHLWDFMLEDYEELCFHDLKGETRRLGSSRPLVFANTSKSGQGMAQAFLDAGAGAFLGSLWEIGDAPAFCFASAFYQRFLTGFPMGEAARWARAQVRETFPGDPTWLAYAVFAHPLAVCRQAHSDESE
ncbi:MAG: TIR domain-containing protein [bacterium]|nr:TIR domain-containing protein [bacterium]